MIKLIFIQAPSAFKNFLQTSFVAVLLLVSSAGVSGQNNIVSESQDRLKKWVETRQLISEESASWKEEKDVLQQSIDLFKAESAKLQKEIDDTQSEESRYSEEFAQQEKLNESLKKALSDLGAQVAGIERRITGFKASLPAPLQEKLNPFLNRIPEDPAQTKLSVPERVQTVVGILSEIDKFQSAITVVGELRKNAAGSEIQVQTLYLGMAQAWFVNAKGDFAGFGKPGAEGWIWKIDTSMAEKITRLIGMYENTIPAEFVATPFEM